MTSEEEAYRRGWNDAIEQATAIVSDVRLHTGSQTVERDMAHRILRRVAAGVALLKVV